MIKTLYSFLFILIVSCSGNKSKNQENSHSLNQLQSGEELVKKTFLEVQQLLDSTSDQFWDMPLYGPILIVDPEDRSFIANQNNLENSFQVKDNVYVGTLPEKLNLANTAFNWDGMRWTMVLLPLPEDIDDRNRLLIHELFHRIQPELGFEGPDLNNNHLDTFEGRILLKLELEALKKALNAINEAERIKHISNAIFFRTHRYRNDEIKLTENSLELNEGLAEYTAIMLGGANEKEKIDHFKNSIEGFYSNPTFVRSFAYQTIPLYGFLLASKDKNWHKRVSSDTNLTDLFAGAFEIILPADMEYRVIANQSDYNYADILQKETIREEKRIAILENYKRKFLEQTRMKISLEKMSISFDPRNLVPLEDVGTVYPNLRISDNWGILTVDSGALISSDWSHVIITKPVEIEDESVKGNGWTLELNPGWEISLEDKIYLINKN